MAESKMAAGKGLTGVNRKRVGGAKETLKCRPVSVPKYGYYVYSSAPQTAPRPMYRYNVAKPRGTHDYYNMMWDPHVYRGDTFVTFQEVEAQRRKEIEGAKERKRKLKRLPPRRLGGIIMPTTPPRSHNHSLVTDLSRFLEETPRVVEEVDGVTQTDLFNDPKRQVLVVPAKIGFDVSTQILPDELFHFEEEVTPVVNTLVDKKLEVVDFKEVLEQSLLENCEEEELWLLKDEQSYYQDRRRLEQLRIHRLAERERLVACERERQMQDGFDQMDLDDELEENIGALLFCRSYLKLMLPNMFDALENDGFLQTTKAAAVTEEFIPWVNQVTKSEISERLLADAMIDDILESVIAARDSETLASNARDEIPGAPDVSEEEDGNDDEKEDNDSVPINKEI